MKTATFSELRNNARRYFDSVERGETIEIYRHGKPVARLLPIKDASLSRWKSFRPVKLPGVSLSRIILEGRREGG
jgi:prevent-host-death family protein